MISLIIPTRNRPDSLKFLLISILKYNNYRDFEIVIVDDHSSEQNRALVQEMINNEKFLNLRIKFIYNDERKYPGYSRNKGVRESGGEVLYFVDDDCIFLGDNLSLIAEFYKPGETANLVLAGDCIYEGPDIKSRLYNNFFRCSLFLFWPKTRRCFIGRVFSWPRMNNFFLKFAPSLNMACRREIFEKAGFSQNKRVNEDEMFCENILEEGCNIIFKKELKLSHKHRFRNFRGLLHRLSELGVYYKTKHILRRLVFALFYPLALSLFTGKIYFIFHYYAMSCAWAFIKQGSNK